MDIPPIAHTNEILHLLHRGLDVAQISSMLHINVDEIKTCRCSFYPEMVVGAEAALYRSIIKLFKKSSLAPDEFVKQYCLKPLVFYSAMKYADFFKSELEDLDEVVVVSNLSELESLNERR